MHKFVETCGSGEPWLQISKFLSHLCLVCHGMHQHLPYRGNHSGRGTFQYFAGPWFKQCRNILDLVGTIAFLTRLVTTPWHVFSQESYELGEAASKGQQDAFARKGSLSYHKCSARGSQYQQLVQGRRPPHKGHSHRVTRFDTSLVSASGVPRSRLEDARGKEKTNIYTRRYWVVVVAIEIGDRWSNQPSNFIRMPAEARARSSLPPLQAASFQFWCLAGPPSTSSLRCQPLFADLSLHHNLGGDPPPLRCLLFHTSPPHQQVSSQPGNERVDLFIPCEGLISRVPFIKRIRAA